MKNRHELSRREFLKRSSAGALGASIPWTLSLAGMGEAAAASNDDYKALVCVFLDGGNDQSNTIIPYDLTSYNRYAAIRQSMARSRDLLLPLASRVSLPDARQMALPPELAALQPLFDDGTMGILCNVGPLAVPTTKTQYYSKSVPLPSKLFSHIDQQGAWQAASPQNPDSGWGGRMTDLMLSGNGGSAFSSVSMTGNVMYLTGKSTAQCQVTPEGAIPLWATRWPLYGSQACSRAVEQLISANYAHALENAHSTVMRRSIEANALLGYALQAPLNPSMPFPAGNTLAAQLQTVARLIAARGRFGVRRQVFHVSLGGFDQHDGLNSRHPALLAQLGQALAAFQSALVDLGVENEVTTFTASDFGRTLTVNGDGSDHGWGSHHFVMGGSVSGQRFWGKLPEMAVDGADDVGQGRLLPSTSVDQLAYELASWFGVSAGDMSTVLPYSGNFDLGRLGLFA